MAFNISDFLNAESKKEIKADWKPVRINVHKLRPAPDQVNFYHAPDKEIRDLAASIELVGLQQYPVVRPIEGTDEYEVIAGHKRRLALLLLVEDGKKEYEMVPCKVEAVDEIQNELILIFTNSTQRERSDYEKMREAERVRELLGEYQKTHELTGRKQDIIAGILGTNKTKIGTLDNINNHLISSFKEEFAAGRISTSTANEIAGLQKDAQEALHETYVQTGALTAKEAKKLKEPTEPPEESSTTAQKPREEPQATRNTTELETGQDAAQEELQGVCTEEPVKRKTDTAPGNTKVCAEKDLKIRADVALKKLTQLTEYLEESEVLILQEIVLVCEDRAKR